MSLFKVIFTCLICIVAFFSALSIDPSLIKIDALTAICTIFSVLAGLILAIYALHISSIEYSNTMPIQTANAVVWDSKKSINRLSYFFYLYLIVLSFSLIVIIGQSIPTKSEWLISIFYLSSKLTVFFSVFAAGMSFFVPLELKYIQERKVAEANEKRNN